MRYCGENSYIKELDFKYSPLFSTLPSYEKECVLDIIQLSYKAGLEDGQKKIKKIKLKKKTRKDTYDSD